MKTQNIMVGWILILLIIAGCGPLLQGKSPKLTNNPYKETAFLMGTVVTLKVYDEGKQEALEKAFDRMHFLADQISAEEKQSEIDKVNVAAGVEPVKVSEDIFRLIEVGKQYSNSSKGSFDISIGPLTSLWHIGFDDAKKPEKREIEVVLPLINYENVELNKDALTVYLKEKGMKLDLGAIAKGYITDEVKEELEKEGVSTAIIDLGGNIFVMGNKPSGDDWTVGIQDPFSARGEIVGKLSVSNRSIVTSGIYERYLEVEGIKYHHLLNPEDGYPFSNDIAGVSIISETSMDGDALSTIIFSKGLEGGLKFLENVDGVEAIFVSVDKKIYTTSGIEEFEITNEAFQMGE